MKPKLTNWKKQKNIIIDHPKIFFGKNWKKVEKFLANLFNKREREGPGQAIQVVRASSDPRF